MTTLMPTQTEVTQQQIPPMLATWREYKARHIDCPQAWSIDEVRQATLGTIRYNIDPNFRKTPKNARWYSAEQKAIRKEFGVLFGKAFSTEDSHDACEYVNHARFQFTRSHSTRDWVDLLREKCNDDYIYACDDCGVIEVEDNGAWAYDGDQWVCQTCLDENYRYSDRRDTYITCDDWYEEEENEEDEEDSIIGDYHQSKHIVGHIPSDYDKTKPRILLGMELEVEVSEDYSREDKAEELYEAIKYTTGKDGESHRYCFIEHDGSLNRGFEIVTGYTGLDVHAKQLEFFKSPWRGVRSHDTRTCGLHVHIDKRDVSLFHACKMVFFINDSNNQKLIKDIARRANADYAQIKNKKASYQWLKRAKSTGNPLNYLNEERREALNFQNSDTIEFRLFKGTLRYETIMACLEFTYATWFFTRDTGVMDLTTPNFINYICKPENRESTKFLRAYLREKNYSLPKLALVKPNPRSADYKPQPVEQLAA